MEHPTLKIELTYIDNFLVGILSKKKRQYTVRVFFKCYLNIREPGLLVTFILSRSFFSRVVKNPPKYDSGKFSKEWEKLSFRLCRNPKLRSLKIYCKSIVGLP